MENCTTNPNCIELVVPPNSGDLPPDYDEICGVYAVIEAQDSVRKPNAVGCGVGDVQKQTATEDPTYTRLVAPQQVGNVYDTLRTTDVCGPTSAQPVTTSRSKIFTCKVVLVVVTVLVLCAIGTFLATFFTIGTDKENTSSTLSDQDSGPSTTTPSHVTGVTHSVDWDQVEYEVTRILTDTTLTIPHGVTKVDVICIGGGGGGGGKDFGYPDTDGGNSTFGNYLRAEGGKGGKVNNTGGEGGYGNVADGGQGGIGGGCSAGAGAAGQTSGGGGGLEPGSSTYPFCGGGASSWESPCSSESLPIASGRSGPGGVDPILRTGGLYGGGGGSVAGRIAGGGGGYSRREVHVTPGQKIDITVGKAGSPTYSYTKPAQGIVVVSWGGPIDLFYNVPITTTSPTVTITGVKI